MKSTKAKKLVALILVLTMTASMFTGCSLFSKSKKNQETGKSEEKIKVEEVIEKEKEAVEVLEIAEELEDLENLEDLKISDKTERINKSTAITNQFLAKVSDSSDISKTSNKIDEKEDIKNNDKEHKNPNAPSTSKDVVSFEKNTVSLEVGMYETLVAKGIDGEATWTSSNPDVVAVSELGTVSAIKKGSSNVTVSVEGKTATCNVVVTEEELQLNHSELILDLYEETTLKLTGTKQTPVWKTSDDTILSVDQNGKIEALGVGAAEVTAAVEGRSVSCAIKILGVDLENNDGTTVSRGQWISELLVAAGYNLTTMDDDSIIWYYSDTQECEDYGKAIEYAHACGILPDIEDEEDVPVFNPNEPATREFAAMTGVRALHYETASSKLDAADKTEVKYPAEAGIAVRQAMLLLDDNNNFRPNSSLSVAEKEQFLCTVLGIKNSENEIANIQPGEIIKEEIEYTPDTISQGELSEITYQLIDYNEETGKIEICITERTDVEIKKGNTLLLPENEALPNGLPVYVEEVTENVNGRLNIKGMIQTDITQILNKLEFKGSAKLDTNNMEGLNGATINYDPTGSISGAESSSYGNRISSAIPGKLTFDLGEGIELNDYVKLEGTVEFEIPNVTLDIDLNKVNFFKYEFQKADISLTTKAEFNGGLKATLLESEYTPGYPGSVEIGRLPFKLGTSGFSVDVVVSVYYGVDGEIKLIYTLQTTAGYQYKNGDGRFIGNVQQDFQLPRIEALHAELGTKFALNVVFMEIWDLVGVAAKVGPTLTGSLTEHVNLGLLCTDGTLYLSLECQLNDETLIGDFLKEKWHYTLSKEFWDENDSPLKIKFHWENGTRVENCTAARGDVKGRVFNSSNEALKGARVTLLNGETAIANAYTNENGDFTLNNVAKGTYTLKISANEYKTFTNKIKVEDGELNQQEDIIMVRRNDIGKGTVMGTVIDATNNNKISKVEYKVYIGWGNSSGDIVATDECTGDYSIMLEPGNYTIVFTAEKYGTTSINVAIAENLCVSKDVEMSPEFDIDSSSFRVVLKWGENPRDLDSHMFGPTESNNVFHVYYSNKNQGETWLDLDDTTSYGPETTTVSTVNDGVYSFYVHDYTNRGSSNSTTLSNSEANVQIFVGDARYAKIEVPKNVGGTVWHVFDYDSRTDEFKLVNTFSYSNDPGNIGRTTYALGEGDKLNFTEDKAIAEIISVTQENLKENIAE